MDKSRYTYTSGPVGGPETNYLYLTLQILASVEQLVQNTAYRKKLCRPTMMAFSDLADENWGRQHEKG